MAIMKCLFCILLLCLLPLISQGQVVAIENENGNILYPCRNILKIAVSGYSNRELSVSSNNGNVEKGNQEGNYIITPREKVTTEIIVSRKTPNGLKVVGRSIFNVEDIPNPIPRLNRQKGGHISASLARAQIAPEAASQSWFCGCYNFQIVAFTLIVIREGKLVFIKTVENEHGTRFSDDVETQKAIQTLCAGDKVLFAGIKCTGPDKKIRNLIPMEFILD